MTVSDDGGEAAVRPVEPGTRSATNGTRAGPNRAQSEAIGSVLLLGVVVVAASVFGVFYLDGVVSDGADGEVSIAGDASAEAIELTHGGGRSLPVDALRVIVRNDSGTTEYGVSPAGVVDGDGDEFFDAGETWRLNWAPSPGEEVTVSLVDEERNRVRYRGAFVPDP